MIRVLGGLVRVSVYFRKNSDPDFSRQVSSVCRSDAARKHHIRMAYNIPNHQSVGAASLAGTTKIKGDPNVPVSRPVVVFDADSMQPVAWTKSSPSGDYRVNGLVVGKPYFVVAFDTTKTYRPAIADVVAV